MSLNQLQQVRKETPSMPSRAELAEPLDDIEEIALREYVLQMEEASFRFMRKVTGTGRHASRALAVLSVASLEASSAFAIVIEETGGPRIEPSRLVHAADIVAQDMRDELEDEGPAPGM